MEFDFITHSVEKDILLVGEVKLSLNQKKMEGVIEKLVEKSKYLPFFSKYKQVRYVIATSDKKSLKSSKVEIIDLSDIF